MKTKCGLMYKEELGGVPRMFYNLNEKEYYPYQFNFKQFACWLNVVVCSDGGRRIRTASVEGIPHGYGSIHVYSEEWSTTSC